MSQRIETSGSAPQPVGGHVPRGALLAAAFLIAMACLAAAIGRLTDFGTLRMTEATVVDYRDLRFLDGDGGSVVVREAKNDRVIAVLPAGTDGFVRGVLRSLARDRKMRDLGDDIPFRLSRRSDGRLYLEDLATGTEIAVSAFGPGNATSFAQLLARNEDRK